jgi:hypothetical protein
MNKYLARLKATIQENPLPGQVSKVPKAPSVTFVTGDGRRVSRIDAPPEPDPVALEERRSMVSDSVPERYLDAWARLRCQCPAGIDEVRWRQPIDNGDRFLDRWGKLADGFGWAPGDLFDVPRNGRMGLVWWLRGRTVTALGPEHA